MKVLIYKTSDGIGSPCKEAKKEKLTLTTESFVEINSRYKEISCNYDEIIPNQFNMPVKLKDRCAKCEKTENECMKFLFENFKKSDLFLMGKPSVKSVSHTINKEKNIFIRKIVREEEIYVIEIDNLSDVLNLVKDYDDLILMSSLYEEFPFVIEIYDDYRE